MTATTEIFTFASPRPQYFSFPFNIIRHLWKNPASPHGLQKLYQTCKYFFNKRQVLIFLKQMHCGKGLFWFTTEIIPLKNKNTLFWFAEKLYFYGDYPNFRQKIYRCTVNSLILYSENIAFDDFVAFAAAKTIKYFDLNKAITYSDESIVPIDVILEMLPNLEEFIYISKEETFLLNTLEKMNALKFNNKFLALTLYFNNASDDFALSVFCDFLKQNLDSFAQVKFNMRMMNIQLVNEFQKEIKLMLETWENDKPTIEILRN